MEHALIWKAHDRQTNGKYLSRKFCEMYFSCPGGILQGGGSVRLVNTRHRSHIPSLPPAPPSGVLRWVRLVSSDIQIIVTFHSNLWYSQARTINTQHHRSTIQKWSSDKMFWTSGFNRRMQDTWINICNYKCSLQFFLVGDFYACVHIRYHMEHFKKGLNKIRTDG